MLVIPVKNHYNTQTIKKALIPHLGKIVKIKYNLGRNKFETYEAKIIKLYNCVFLIELVKYMNKLYLILDFYYKIRYTENGIMLEGRG